MRIAILICLLVLTALPAVAKEPQQRIDGIYSDLRRSKETDDLDGTEIIIIGRYSRYFAFYQFWEGGSLPPVAVPVAVSGNHISFSVPASSGECGYYEGTISARGFDGSCTIPHPSDSTKEVKIHIPRVTKSFWQ